MSEREVILHEFRECQSEKLSFERLGNVRARSYLQEVREYKSEKISFKRLGNVRARSYPSRG